MEVSLRTLPRNLNEFGLTREIASIVHSDEFYPRKPDERKLNFHVALNRAEYATSNDGTGTITFATQEWGNKFLRWIRGHPLRIAGAKIDAQQSQRTPEGSLVERLLKTAYQDPDIQEKYQNILAKLEAPLRINVLQIGVFYRERYPSDKSQQLGPRSFSIEWEKEYESQSAAWLRMNYDQRRIVFELGSVVTEKTGKEVSVPFANIQRIGVGNNPEPYLCIDTLVPPLYEDVEFYSTSPKPRLGYIHSGHKRVAPYAKDLRVVLRPEGSNFNVIDRFAKLCQYAGLPSTIIARPKSGMDIVASKRNFYHANTVYNLHKEFSSFPWPVAFQLESLLRKGLLHTGDLQTLKAQVRQLCERYPDRECGYVGDLLRWYSEALRTRPLRESPQQCFTRIQQTSVPGPDHVSLGNFLCYHVSFTPTRLVLEGPFPIQANPVPREYTTIKSSSTPAHPNDDLRRVVEYECNFLRVDFREEDGSQYQWEEKANNTVILEERVRNILQYGFKLAGREFKFLGFSLSMLREHAVWFMHSFKHVQLGLITPPRIRNSLVNISENDSALRCPPKYAARLAQAFTAIECSVQIRRSQWEEVEDTGTPSHHLTNNIGTISQTLGDRIWEELRSKGRCHTCPVKPTVYEIRFLGYQGVVAVDKQLDQQAIGVELRLRSGMRKFDAKEEKEAAIEVTWVFEGPEPCYLNRSLITVLEEGGVDRSVFTDLQSEAVSETRSIDQSSQHFQQVLNSNELGQAFRLSFILDNLKTHFNLDIEPKLAKEKGIDNAFFRQLRNAAVESALKDIKYRAKIKVPGSYMLVGVVDEGPMYERLGYKDVYCLPEKCIYACVQLTPDSEPTWLNGFCVISKGPVVHPGEVRRIRAIGKPPENKLCLFAHLKNCVVVSSLGDSPLIVRGADRALFSVIHYAPLIPSMMTEPPSYEDIDPQTLDRDALLDDIYDFVVDYIKSDVADVLLDRLLIISDQSEDELQDAMHDPYCEELAALCNKAIGYPDKGILIDLNTIELPPLRLRSKPDWHGVEAGPGLFGETDYYISTRVLGLLYNDITIKDDTGDATQGLNDNSSGDMDPISTALWNKFEFLIDEGKIDSLSSEVEVLFKQYVEELRYICITHIISNSPSSRLQETEVALGVILGQCTQPRFKDERVKRMRDHSSILASQIRRSMVDLASLTGDVNDDTGEMDEDDQDLLVHGLHVAWVAWRHSVKISGEFGAKTFGLIALSAILDCLSKLGWDVVDDGRPAEHYQEVYENDYEEADSDEWERA
ncbi:hypothetical protein AX16_001583 [Volvariella volvacea WC 439]|nr:hypothetical protein AX16_001583 [Volvariella volvacea WC 439]